MIFQVYAVKDELAGTFGNLMVVNEKVAARTFKWMAQEMEKSDTEDKRVYLMAKYDNENGMSCQSACPEMAYNLEIMKKEQEEKANASTNL